MFDAGIIALAIFGFTVLLVAVGGYVAFLLGKEKTEKKIAEANIQAIKSAKQTGEEIEKLSDADLRKRSDKWLR
jgi:uncharacterized protein YpmB